MMSLNTVEAKLPPGFRFHPRDDELICEYLAKRVACCDQPPLMIQVDLNKCEPWDIPESACVGGKEYYFYSLRDRKYATGLRTNRATISGYWKATGKDRAVLRKGTLVGMRKTLVFYQGRAPKGRKTDWVMHEFRLEGPLGPPRISSLKEDWVLCRVFFKNRDNIVAKQEMNVYNDTGEESSPSTSLPPLMDPYMAFDQTHQTHSTTERQQEQVPCFSIFATTDQLTHQPNNTNQQPFSYLTAHLELLPNLSTKTPPPNFNNIIGGFPADFGPNYLSSSSSSSYCDHEKVLKAVLNQLTTYDGGPNNNIVNIKGISSPSFGEAASTSDSFLSEVALSTMWHNQFSSSS